MAVRTALLTGGAVSSLFASTACAEPFLTRNQNPLLALYGLPSPLPARLPAAGRWRAAGVVNWSNSASIETSGASSFTLDAEAIEFRAHVEHGVGPTAALRVELPWRRVSAGTLDRFIENWHDWFSLPNGSRDQLPRDELRIEYAVGEVTQLLVDESTSGPGDIPLAVGYQVHASETHALATWLSLKLPVGEADELTGSGAVDVALSLSYQARPADRWQLFGQLNGAWLGEGEFLPESQESTALSALAGVTWNPWRNLDLTMQLEATSRVFDVEVEPLSGDALVFTFGGSYRTPGGWRFDLGISEDVEVDASPDVNFNLAVRRGY